MKDQGPIYTIATVQSGTRLLSLCPWLSINTRISEESILAVMVKACSNHNPFKMYMTRTKSWEWSRSPVWMRQVGQPSSSLASKLMVHLQYLVVLFQIFQCSFENNYKGYCHHQLNEERVYGVSFLSYLPKWDEYSLFLFWVFFFLLHPHPRQWWSLPTLSVKTHISSINNSVIFTAEVGGDHTGSQLEQKSYVNIPGL